MSIIQLALLMIGVCGLAVGFMYSLFQRVICENNSYEASVMITGSAGQWVAIHRSYTKVQRVAFITAIFAFIVFYALS